MTEEKRTLIETFLPVDEISSEAKIEKKGRAPTFELHYWWTRKPLITARAAVLGALLPSNFDQQEFKKLLGLEQVKTKGKRANYFDIPLDRIEQLKNEYKNLWGEIPTVLDPFAGGGSIPFEALRVGVDAVANDYNPVANLIEKATLEYPQKYGEKLYTDVKNGLEWVFNETKKEMEHYYPEHNGKIPVAYIWSWMVRCPNCNFDNPLVGQWGLVSRAGVNRYIEPSIIDGNLHLEIKTGKKGPDGTCESGKGKCLNCGSTIPSQIIKNDIAVREQEKLLSVVLLDNTKKEYVLANQNDDEAINRVKAKLAMEWDHFIKEDLIPNEEIPEDTRGSLSARIYLKYWHKLLNPRQKLLFVTLLKNIQKFYERISPKYDKEYATAVITYISFIFGKHIDYNCRCTTWTTSAEKIGHSLAARGIPIMWNHAEVNPFVKGSGTLISVNKSILDSLEYSIEKLSNSGKIEILNNSITNINQKTKLIVTDPPYFDDIRYAEFSEFFYVWEKRAIKIGMPLENVPKAEEMSVGGWGRTPDFFNKLFSKSCKKFNECLYDDGLLIMFFAHSSVEAWDFVINSLQKNGFRITATWPVHTESADNVIAQGHASIMSSIIIVARKRKYDKSGYFEEIQDEINNHLLKRLDEFWKYGLRGADLTVSSMGATLDIITQYSEIKSYTGEMSIEHVLKLVQQFVAQYVLNRYIQNAKGLDAATSFYLYTRLSQLEGMPFDTANLIAKSMNSDLKLLETQGLIYTMKKGKTQAIVLHNFANREINTKQSLIDCVQFVMATYVRGGYSEVQRELVTISFSRTEIKEVLEALISLPTDDPERQVAQKILERMGQSFPKQGQTGLDNF